MQQIWTIGHSTRTLEEFLAALQAHGVRAVADVRKLPGSRLYPHFNSEELESALAGAGIGYAHLPELGGRRKPRADSQNLGWRNESFRGYADHMETAEFASGIERLREFEARSGPVALLCAEALWWKCHRGLIADYLKIRGAEVTHIIDAKKTERHPFTKAARVIDGELRYDLPAEP